MSRRGQLLSSDAAAAAGSDSLASIDETSESYRLRLATSAADIDAALKLRFDVFNLELGEGLDSAYASMRDEDCFDPFCHHLLVEHVPSRAVIGTYRLIPYQRSLDCGFYSDQEFRLSDLPNDVLKNSIELGRACIAASHRNSRVLYLLWLGLARYMTVTQSRYFFGCCSLTSQDAAEGYSVADQLETRGHRSPNLTVAVRDAYRIERPADDSPVRVKIPKLMRLYLQYGVSIVSDPALDRDFKTIDFLALFDLASLDARARRMFGLPGQV